MKKYVKPLMESEVFVSNEYISTCYTITCGKCGSWQEGYDQLAGDVDSKPITNPFSGEVVYTGTFYPSTLEHGSNNRPDGTPCVTYSGSDRISFWDIFEGLGIDWDKAWQWLIQQIYGYNQSSISVHQDINIVPNWTHTTNHPNASI